MVCTFFGHRQVPEQIEESLRKVLVALIEQEHIYKFYVGNQGGFDRTVLYVLRLLKKQYPQIEFSVVLAYMPDKNSINRLEDFSETIFHEGQELTPLKFAISKRNIWLIEHSDVVITYVKHTWGGAAKFKALSEKRGKRVINLD